MVGLVILLWTCFLQQSYSSIGETHAEYLAECTLNRAALPCMISLFSSHKAWTLSGIPLMSYQEHSPALSKNALEWESLPTLCQIDSDKRSSLKVGPRGGMMFVKRGECAFDQKARVAEQMYLQLLIVVDSGYSKSEEKLFPMGSMEESYECSLPVLLITHNTWQNISHSLKQPCSISEENQECAATGISLYFDMTWRPKEIPKKSVHSTATSITKSVSEDIENNISILRSWCAVLCFVILLLGIFLTVNSCISADNVILGIMLVGYISTFVIFRLGTTRLMNNGGNGLLSHVNHRETDELIFEELIRTTDPFNIYTYTLQGKNVIEKLSLATENYDLPLFIHPPLFVYFSIFLTRVCGISLYLIPILMQSIGIMALLVICREIVIVLMKMDCVEPQKYGTVVASMFNYSCMVMLCCPILWFISQKVWIDNALLMTTMITVAGHMVFTRLMMNSSSVWFRCFMSFISGFLWFGLSLNCKITALGLLPFVVGWIWFHQYILIRNSTGCYNSGTVVSLSLICCVFCLGAIVSLLPWTFLYSSTTGRFLPSAWPSQSMLERFPFVKAAVNKPWHYYFTSLSWLSPLHIGGMVYLVYETTQILILSFCNPNSSPNNTAVAPPTRYQLLVLTVGLWPISFICAFTILGCLGAGFQLRFLAPMLPGSFLLSSLGMTKQTCLFLSTTGVSHTSSMVATMFFNIGVVVSMFCGIYYGVLYPPLFADLQFHSFDIVKSIISNPYAPLYSQENTAAMINFMQHFGLKLKN